MFEQTHTTPAAGMSTWPSPDVSQPEGPALTAGLPVKVLEWWGDWARVECHNGWVAWVDGRHLVPLATTQPVAAVAPPPPAAMVVPPALDTSPVHVGSVRLTVALVGSVAAGISVFLPWVSAAGVSNNAMSNTPLAFLWDNETTDTGGLQIGWVVLALAALGVVLSLRPGTTQLRRAVGWALVLIPTVFVAQLQRNIGSAEAGTVFSFLGFGVYTTLGAGLLVAMGKSAE
jgi:hypothetical protein